MNEITLYKHNDLRVNIDVANESGSPIDLSAAQSIVWQVSKLRGSPALLSKTKQNGDFAFPAASVLYFDITSTESDLDAGTYYHELTVTTLAGLTYTVIQDRFIIKARI